MSQNLKFTDHIQTIATRCRSLSGWILRTFITRDSVPMMKLFNSLLIPRIDYCSQLWAPHLIKEWEMLEQIQRRFTSRISGLEELNYWERLKKLRQYSIERRTERYQIIYIWKIIEGLAPNLATNKITVRNNERRGKYCIVPKFTTAKTCSSKLTTIRENTFSIRALKLFNCLPPSIRNITGVGVNTFKHHLDHLLNTVPDQPSVSGYSGSRAARTNSIIDQILISGGGESRS